MAVTGIILTLFVVGHMIGNLQVYLGARALNDYGELLRHFGHGCGLWVVRAGLLATISLHVWAAVSLTWDNRAARPVGYRDVRRQKSTYASRTMIWSGPILVLFIVYHLLHLTTGNAHGDFVPGDVYHNVIAGFSVWAASAAYILAMVALGLHLYHGVWSLLQTLGLSHPRYNRLRTAFSALLAGAVVAGNVSIPVAVLLRLVQ